MRIILEEDPAWEEVEVTIRCKEVTPQVAGLVASLLAQGMEPVEAAALAVWIHGRAGDLAQAERTAYAMAPEDLPEAFPRVFRELIRTD